MNYTKSSALHSTRFQENFNSGLAKAISILVGVQSKNPRGHFQFLCVCDAADARVQAVVVVSLEQLHRVVLGIFCAFDDVLVEPFMPDGAVVTLDVGVLLRLAGLDVLDGDAPTRSPDQQLATDLFRAVVDPYRAGLSAQFDDAVLFIGA